MLRILTLLLAMAFAPLAPTPAFAVFPDEVLEDPVLEARARELSKGLRCLVCRNESIDESNAGLARDLRLLVRERLVAGDSDEEAMDFIVDRYGEYVLLQPTVRGANIALWLAGPLMLLVALAIGIGYLRRRSAAAVAAEGAEALSAEETARLKDILGQ
ncbi:cytochrome c-type biogenesis protein CcmH [Pseudoruegeria sp. SHC-113]|uniref:cytochrome c-type biogenesis protein n=1 Tax=Pseudoruegeria sp. SHC-113 TaxID=2855439 RepID=UPI0021BA6306|nr:cytochrome c-type biogenesis protein [Pseudoruegeria sp. SHC-113]MCT8160803.1 cytochrome c-type biogenesis protein CcmH [Pseudoruegeria sp. SHC-113]